MSGVALSTPGIIRAPMADGGIYCKKVFNLFGIVLLDKKRKGINRGPYVTAAIPRISGIKLFTVSPFCRIFPW